MVVGTGHLMTADTLFWPNGTIIQAVQWEPTGFGLAKHLAEIMIEFPCGLEVLGSLQCLMQCWQRRQGENWHNSRLASR